MKRLAIVMLGMAAVGCSSGPPPNAAKKEDLEALEQRLTKKIEESIFAIEKQLPGVEKRYNEMLTTHQDMKNTLEDLRKVDAKKALVAVLQQEEQLLVERLASLRKTLAELKKE